MSDLFVRTEPGSAAMRRARLEDAVGIVDDNPEVALCALVKRALEAEHGRGRDAELADILTWAATAESLDELQGFLRARARARGVR